MACLVAVLNSTRVAYTSQPSQALKKQPHMRHLRVVWLPAYGLPALGDQLWHVVWLPALSRRMQLHAVWLPAWGVIKS